MPPTTFPRPGRTFCATAVGLALFCGASTLAAPADARHESTVDARIAMADDASAEGALRAATSLLINQALGLRASDVIVLDTVPEPDTAFLMHLRVDGVERVLDVAPFDVRTRDYELLAQQADGTIVQHPHGVNRTFRGHVRELPGSIVAGSVLEDGLHAMIRMPGGDRVWIQPVTGVAVAPVGAHVVYRGEDVMDHGGTCGITDQAAVAQFGNGGGGGGDPTQGAGTPCIAELACDADVEYFNDYGSVAAVENRINSVINTVNVQYENQVSITHQVSAIVVRTANPDPYSSNDPVTLLCQFITEWTNNQTGVQRDVAHLFTGREISGSVIGIASDIGGTGICVNQGSCTGGQFGTQGSYCLSQSDFNGNFSCATDLTAHELGHLWGAFHCSCSGNTMNSSITCANNFSGGSISSISAYRDTRTCLDGDCAGAGGGPANDDCADAIMIPCTTTETVNNSLATPPINGGDDGDLPNGSPSCQWSNDPNAVHNTVWYTFVADDTSIEIQTCSTSGVEDTILGLYSGSCNNLTELACGEDDCGSSGWLSTICYNGLTPGQTYTIMVGNPGSWSGSLPGIITLDLECPCPTIGPVAGACCLQDGTCIGPVTAAQCAAQGGTFQGSGTNCADVICGPVTGACCDPCDGTCINLTPTQCAALGGVYQGDGTTCAQVNCPRFGACCDPNDGTCSVVEPDQCAAQGGVYQGNCTDCASVNCPLPTGACCDPCDGTCVSVTAAQCAAQGGLYQGDGTTCAQVNCPRFGACCDPNDGTCSVVEPDQCAAQGGVYQGNCTDCASVNCPLPTGACCDPCDGTCVDVTAAQCAAQGGLYQGDGTDCAQVNCPRFGACCDPNDGTCSVVEPDQCAAQGGVYQGNCTDCASVNCPLPTGACCDPCDGTCVDVTAAQCAAQGGLYQGDGSDCSQVACPILGACCDPCDGTCIPDVSPNECGALGGIYQGDCTECSQVTCEERGACCDPTDGTCQELDPNQCAAQGGVYQGACTDCATVNCPLPDGACCFDDGTCADALTEADCSATNGVWQGPLTDCASTTCPPPSGACCLCDGTCIDGLEEVECSVLNGSYQGNGSDCTVVQCEPIGECCDPCDGICIESVTLNECVAIGGIYQGDCTSCLSVICDERGACCDPNDGTCLELSPNDCAAQGGVFQGTCTECSSVSCPVPCIGDLDGDGNVGFSDLVAVLSAWGPCPGCPQDLDGDGNVGFADIVIVLSAWGPCP